MQVKQECKQESLESNFLISLFQIEPLSPISSNPLRTISDPCIESQLFNNFLNGYSSQKQRVQFRQFQLKIIRGIRQKLPSYRGTIMKKLKNFTFLFFEIMHLVEEPVSIHMLKLLLVKLTIQNGHFQGNISQLTKTCRRKIYDIRSVLEGSNLIMRKTDQIVMLVNPSREIEAVSEFARSQVRQHYLQQHKKVQQRIKQKQKEQKRLKAMLEAFIEWKEVKVQKNRDLYPENKIIEFPFMFIHQQNYIDCHPSKKKRQITMKIEKKNGIVSIDKVLHHLHSYFQQMKRLRRIKERQIVRQNIQRKLKNQKNQAQFQQIFQQQDSMMKMSENN